VRIKKDKQSWAAGGIIKRDANQDKSFDGSTGTPKKKNKKKWCKGQVGKKHDLEWRPSRFHEQRWPDRVNNTKEAVCKRCSKILRGWVTDWELWKQDPNDLYNK
jgi:hypothetical protein